MTSAIQRGDCADDLVHRLIDMLEMGAEAEDRAAETEAAVDARAAQHHAALFLDVPDQALVELIGIAALRQIAEGDDRQIGSGPGSHPSSSDSRAWK